MTERNPDLYDMIIIVRVDIAALCRVICCAGKSISFTLELKGAVKPRCYAPSQSHYKQPHRPPSVIIIPSPTVCARVFAKRVREFYTIRVTMTHAFIVATTRSLRTAVMRKKHEKLPISVNLEV